MLTETDTLVYEIETSGVYEDLYLDKKIFGFSEYLDIIGKMKGGTKSVPIAEFVILKSKIYSFVKYDGLGDRNTI